MNTQKLILCIICAFSSLVNTYASVSNGYYITLEDDTVDAIIMAGSTIDGYLDFVSVTKKLTIMVDHKLVEFRPPEIKGFLIVEKDGVKRRFISVEQDPYNFYRVIFDGDVTFLERYSPSKSYNGSTYVYKEGELHALTPLTSKSKISKLISDKPSVKSKWENREIRRRDYLQLFIYYNAEK